MVQILPALLIIMNRVVVIHGSADDAKDKTYDKHWMPWLKKQLYLKNISSEFPRMPKCWNPNYEDYKKVFQKYSIDQSTTLIGHSSGCAFLVRWLGESKQRVDKLILVAPWKIAAPKDAIRSAFYNYPIDKTINSRVKEIVIFTADNEEEDGKKSGEQFHRALGGKIINLKGKGHYTLEDMGTEKFPELLEEILK